jgi:hypothetical protein
MTSRHDSKPTHTPSLQHVKNDVEKMVMTPFKTMERELEKAPAGPPAPSPHTWAGFMYVVGMQDLIPAVSLEYPAAGGTRDCTPPAKQAKRSPGATSSAANVLPDVHQTIIAASDTREVLVAGGSEGDNSVEQDAEEDVKKFDHAYEGMKCSMAIQDSLPAVEQTKVSGAAALASRWGCSLSRPAAAVEIEKVPRIPVADAAPPAYSVVEVPDVITAQAHGQFAREGGTPRSAVSAEQGGLSSTLPSKMTILSQPTMFFPPELEERDTTVPSKMAMWSQPTIFFSPRDLEEREEDEADASPGIVIPWWQVPPSGFARGTILCSQQKVKHPQSLPKHDFAKIILTFQKQVTF